MTTIGQRQHAPHIKAAQTAHRERSEIRQRQRTLRKADLAAQQQNDGKQKSSQHECVSQSDVIRGHQLWLGFCAIRSAYSFVD